MECTPGSDGRWPDSESACGRHGSCVALPSSTLVPSGGSGSYYCACDSEWSSSGDFMAAPFAACHVNQKAILWMWVGSLVATLVCALLCARVVRHYIAILRAQNQRKESTRISKLSQRPGGPVGSTAAGKSRGFSSSRCRFLSRGWSSFYAGFVFIFHNHTRRCLVGSGFMLFLYIILCSLKIATLARHQSDHDVEDLLSAQAGRTGSLIGFDVFPTVLYCLASLVFMVTGHWSSLIWCASAQAFYSKAEGAKLEAKTKRELVVASLVGISCYILPWIGLALASDKDEGAAYEIILALHFQLKGFVPVAMSITDQRIARRVINNLKRHQETQERLANKQHEQQQAMVSAHRPLVLVAAKPAVVGTHSGLASPSALGSAAPNVTVHAHGAMLGAAGAAAGGGGATKERKIVSRPTGEEDDAVLVSVSRPGSQQQGEETLLLQTQQERLKSPMSSSTLSQGGVSFAFASTAGGGDASGRSRMTSAQRDRERQRRTMSLDALPAHQLLTRQTSVELAPIPSDRSGSGSGENDRDRERMLVEFTPSASPNLGPSLPTASLISNDAVTAAWGVPPAGARSSSDEDAADTGASPAASNLAHPRPRYAPSSPPAKAESDSADFHAQQHQQHLQQQQLPGTVSASPRASTPARRATDPASNRTVVVRISDGEGTTNGSAASNANGGGFGATHGRSESGSVRQLQLRVHVAPSETSAFLSAARLSHLASSVSPVAEPVHTPVASDLPPGGAAAGSGQQSRRMGARPSQSSAALTHTASSTTSSAHLMPHRPSHMHSSTQHSATTNPSRRSSSPTPASFQQPGNGKTGASNSLAVPGASSGASGTSTTWGSAAPTQPPQQQPARTSQAELQAENRSKIADFTASLGKHNRSARATSLVWLLANSFFAWMPLLRSFVPFVMPVHVIFTLIAMRTFLMTLMPRSAGVAAPASQRPDGNAGGAADAGGHSVNPSATRTLVTAANEIHTRAEPESKV